jgi:hypothetical protein
MGLLGEDGAPPMSVRRTWRERGGECSGDWSAVSERHIWADGVAHMVASRSSPASPLRSAERDRRLSTCGVGHVLASADRIGRSLAPAEAVRFVRVSLTLSFDVGVGQSRTEYAAAPEEWLSTAVAVGQYEEAFPEMGCPDLGCREHVPLRIEPERGQVPENLAEPPAAVDRKETWDVLQERDAWSYLAKNPCDVGP